MLAPRVNLRGLAVVLVTVRLVGDHWGRLVERLELMDVVNAAILGQIEVEVDWWLHLWLQLLIGAIPVK